jgi:glycosyltransferase involved in cell wall biosynthesis
MNKLPISVCIISGAEAHRIGRALTSVAAWAGEIIIVLNEDVRDGTEELCLAQGAKVFREPWQGYVVQKNSALEKAAHPWLLNLDADEEVSPALREEISRTVTGPHSDTAFSFPRCTYFCGRWIRHGDWYPDRQTRLWKRGQARWVGTNVHEKLEVDGSIGSLNGELLHHTAETIDRQIAKISTYTEGFAQAAIARGGKFGALDMMVRPGWRFFRGYFFRLGFLDGWQGCYIAWMTAFYTATRYAKVRVAQQSSVGKP